MQEIFASICTRVGLVCAEPIRMMGLVSSFEDHPSIRIHIGELDMLLADRSLHYLILDVNYDPMSLETQSRVRRLRPDIGQILLD